MFVISTAGYDLWGVFSLSCLKISSSRREHGLGIDAIIYVDESRDKNNPISPRNF